MARRAVLFLARAVAALALLGCTSEKPERPGTTFTDDAGRTVVVAHPVARVVSLAPNLTEIVASIGGTSLLVGTDDFSNHPPEVARLPKVGGIQPSVEAIVALRPDVVLSSSSVNQSALASALAGAGIPVYVARTDRMVDIARVQRNLAKLLGTKGGEAASRTLAAKLEDLREPPRQRPAILYLVWPDPVYIAGHGTYVDDLFVLEGARNAVPYDVTGWPQYSIESLLEDPPDIVLHPEPSLTAERMRELQSTDPRWKAVLANATVAAVPEDLFSRPGPRVVEAATRIGSIIDAWNGSSAPAPRRSGDE